MRIRFAIAVLIIAATCVSCILPPPAPPPAAAAGRAHITANCLTDDGPDFVKRFGVVRNGQVITPTPSLSAAQVTDLTNAYCNAPVVFRKQLDNIDLLFISADTGACTTPGDPTTCSALPGDQAALASWGARLAGGYTQIGLPGGLWPMGQAAETYPAYETEVLNGLMKWNLPGSALRFSAPTNPNEANTSWMTVLAVLAHEAGHVRWYEAGARSGWGFPYDFKRLNDCNFFDSGWQSTSRKTLISKNRWRKFGETAATNEDTPNDHPAPEPGLAQFLRGVSDQTRLDNLALLLNGDQPWASFQGSRAPDEDFVETFKFAILTNAGTTGLTTLPLAIPTSNGTVKVDIPAFFAANDGPGHRTVLGKKIRCLKRWT